MAMTRAKRHLVLVGYGLLDEPAKIGADARPLDWIRARLSLDRENRPDLDQLEEIDEITGAMVGLRVCVDADDVLIRAEKSTAAHELSDGYDSISPSVNDLPGPPKYLPPVISPTALDTYRACPRRYYLQNVLNVAALFELKGMGKAAAGGCVLSATQMGSLIHKILESDLRGAAGGLLASGYLEKMSRELFGDDVSLAAADHERATALLATFAKLPWQETWPRPSKPGSCTANSSSRPWSGKRLSVVYRRLCPMPANHGAAASETTASETTNHGAAPAKPRPR